MIKLNGIEVKATIFPDKTSQVWKLPAEAFDFSEYHIVEWDFESESEFMHLAQLKWLLDYRNEPSTLYLPYLPYARQDKQVTNNSTFALFTFVELLNLLAFDEVSVLDPHSECCEEIANLVPLNVAPYIDRALCDTLADSVCTPDSGAFKRYHLQIPAYADTVSAYKIRDQLTGEISEYGFTRPNLKKPNEVIKPDLHGRSVLIVDDICDGGATFKLCAEKLYEAGAEQVHLYVTHGLFTKGTETLRDSGIRRIFTRKGEVV